MRNAVVVCSVMALTAAAPRALAEDRHVTTGSELTQALSQVQAGDTVYLADGEYDVGQWGVTISNSGTADAWITIKAEDGALPILTGPGASATEASGVGIKGSYIRIEGIVSRNWGSGGFGNGWTSSSCSPLSNGNIAFKNVIAEGNGINGIAFYCAAGLLIEQSIIAHNGNGPKSWSSGVNLFGAQGTAADNIVRQSISFENVDISSNHSDGSGFILDQNSKGATFENNIGFRNGGSCIRLTNSPNAQLINNTCVNNGLDTSAKYHDEIFYSDASSRTGSLLLNNLCIPTSGQSGLTMGDGVPAQNNIFDGTGTLVVSATGTLDFRLQDGSEAVDAGSGSGAPATDIGFDWGCITSESGALSWWQYAPDYDYIRSVGGVQGCFSPTSRDTPDVGAHELGGGAPPVEDDPDDPVSDPPVTDPPATDPPATDPPVTQPPVSEPPATDPPVTEPPATDPPVSEPPATDPPVTEPPATDPPVSEPPTTDPVTPVPGTDTPPNTPGGGAPGSTPDDPSPSTGGGAGAGPSAGPGAASSGGGAADPDPGGAATEESADTEGPCAPLSECNGICVNLASNATNCGACGAACPTGQVCSLGVCGLECSTGLELCAQSCVDPTSDPLNCGGCDLACAPSQTCNAGQCVAAAPVAPAIQPIEDSGGCAAAGGTDPGRGPWLGALLLGLVVASRHRRRG